MPCAPYKSPLTLMCVYVVPCILQWPLRTSWVVATVTAWTGGHWACSCEYHTMPCHHSSVLRFPAIAQVHVRSGADKQLCFVRRVGLDLIVCVCVCPNRYVLLTARQPFTSPKTSDPMEVMRRIVNDRWPVRYPPYMSEAAKVNTVPACTAHSPHTFNQAHTRMIFHYDACSLAVLALNSARRWSREGHRHCPCLCIQSRGAIQDVCVCTTAGPHLSSPRAQAHQAYWLPTGPCLRHQEAPLVCCECL